MVSHVTTVALQGIEAVPVDVQVQIAPGGPFFAIVGLPDKAVAESRERVRCALHASGLSLPPKRIIVNLAPGAYTAQVSGVGGTTGVALIEVYELP